MIPLACSGTRRVMAVTPFDLARRLLVVKKAVPDRTRLWTLRLTDIASGSNEEIDAQAETISFFWSSSSRRIAMIIQLYAKDKLKSNFPRMDECCTSDAEPTRQLLL